ncbi:MULTISPECIES: GGDEF domain-containing protein [unclassified Sulfurospirillum]|uniref:GGDEF domain-containing protein n=1 Tax=unclassified Sulfurospirillum TaxID=2618290 RepID=UPI00068D937B|nr:MULTISPECIES: GGDEF domain-containing protein [unclassified Sulfurospirillum]
MLNFFYRFFISNRMPLSSYASRQYSLVMIFASLGAVTFGFFFFYNLMVLHYYTIALIDTICFATSVGAILFLKKTHNIELGRVFVTAYFFIFFVAFTYINKNESFGLIWNIFFCMIAINLNGHKKGLFYTFVLYGYIFLMAHEGIGVWQNGLWDKVAFFRYVFSMVLLTFVVYVMELALYRSYTKLQKLAEEDELTQTYNRHKLREILQVEIERTERHHTPLCVVLFDVDNFKSINDTYGHNAGDAVLKRLAKLVKNSIRVNDTFGRWGGEEFLLILPHMRIEETQKACEKIRLLITQSVFESVGTLTCSFGMCAYEKGMSLDALVNRCDKAMYHAKMLGKNCVSIFSQS